VGSLLGLTSFSEEQLSLGHDTTVRFHTVFSVFTEAVTSGEYQRTGSGNTSSSMASSSPGLSLSRNSSQPLNTSHMSQEKLTSKRLLFVDDEPGIRETLAIILRRYGFAVTLAATVSEALNEIQTQEFGLLLCDLNIEGENDGFEVIRAMRAANPHCVTIILTGYPMEESAEEGIQLGIDDYIAKPARVDVLVAMLAEKLAGRQRLAASPS
jgi:CheY-like chemotaxis protein